nr:immunoglobulin light chain junction region [Macaca mulatta]
DYYCYSYTSGRTWVF